MEAVVLWLIITANPVRGAEPKVEEAPTKEVCMNTQRANFNTWCVPLIREKKP